MDSNSDGAKLAELFSDDKKTICDLVKENDALLEENEKLKIEIEQLKARIEKLSKRHPTKEEALAQYNWLKENSTRNK